jgi:hypothetical protein
MIIKSLGPFSVAKINGILGAIMGFIFGIFFTLFTLLIGAVASGFGEGPEPTFITGLFGIGAVIFMPIFYGIVGFLSGLIAAWLYNVIAGWIGGIEIEFESTPGGSVTSPTQQPQ